MAAYLRFYQFDASPFESGKAKRGLVLGTPSLRGALAKVKQSLNEGSPRICLTGSAGVGKTSFSRALPKLLADTAQVALILDPSKPWREIHTTIAKRFNLTEGAISRKALLAVRESGKNMVVIFDKAEALSHESLDHLDVLLQYKCEYGNQLLHCVMLADLDAASSGTDIPLLWWLDKFTTLQLQFSPIPAEGLRHYVEKHLAKAGWAGGELFTREALVAIHRNTGGIPRAINELCEKILIEGGRREINSISADFIDRLCGDSIEVEGQTLATEHSQDTTGGNFGALRDAQIMPSVEARDHRYPTLETLEHRKPILEPVEDIASLLITRDSAESLQVAGADSQCVEESPGLELEDEPPSSAQPDCYDHPQSVGAPVGMIHASAPSRSHRTPSAVVVGLAVAAWLAYALYSLGPESTEIIKSAEISIVKAIKKQTMRDSEATLHPPTETDLDQDTGPVVVARALPATSDSDIAQTAVTVPNRAPTSSIRISSEPIVVNEYTAIPEAASSNTATPARIAPSEDAR